MSEERISFLEGDNLRLRKACAGALERLNRIPVPSAFPRMADALALTGAREVLRVALAYRSKKNKP